MTKKENSHEAPREPQGINEARQLEPRQLRELAQRLESEAGAAVDALSELEFPLVTGDLKDFPRPSGEHRAAEEGVKFLRESLNGAAAALYASSAAREQGREAPDILFAAVEPYVNSLLRRQ
jgi:hypothetical protein